MAKTARKKKPASKKKATIPKPKKVWRIFRFSERYELPEYMRKGRVTALEFTRDFVGDAGGDEAVGYQHQFRMLSNGDGAEYSRHYGVYRQLINMAAKRSRAYRGYLIDAKNQPLSDGQLGKLLNYKTGDMRKILRRLASVDLLERVDLPEFDLSLNKLPPSKWDNDNKKKQGKKTGGRKRADQGGNGRKIPPKNGNPLKKRQRFKEKGLNSEYLNGNDKSLKGIKNDKRCRSNSNALKGQGKSQTTTTPTTAPPFVPSESDAGGSVISFHGPPGSAKHNRNQPQMLGEIIEDMKHHWDHDAKEFGSDIYIALKLPWDPVSNEGRRELGCFASAWMKAKALGISPQSLDSLWKKAVDIAHKIAKKRPKYPNPSRVWRGIFNKLLASKRSKTQCKTG